MMRPFVVGAALVVVGALALYVANGGWGCRCPRVRSTGMIMHTVKEAVVHYRVDHADACPPTIQALVDGRYLTHEPRDIWGQSLLYQCPGAHDADAADLTSGGPDRRFGTADDVRSWDP